MKAGQLTIQITWKCNARCSHCFQTHASPEIDLDLLKSFVDHAAEHRLFRRLAITGGEPSLRKSRLMALVAHSFQFHRIPHALTTNGVWAEDKDEAKHFVTALINSGLEEVVLSFDVFHLPWIGVKTIQNAVDVLNEAHIPYRFYVCHDSEQTLRQNKELLAQLEHEKSSEIEYRPVMHGNVRSIDSQTLNEVSSSCPAKNFCTIWPDGQVLPCCTAASREKFSVGRLGQDSNASIVRNLARAARSDFMKPYGIGGAYLGLSGEVREKIKERRFLSACDLCHAVTEHIERGSLFDRGNDKTLEAIANGFQP